MKKIDIPEVGQYYHFFDDGKTSPNRHYICKIERIIKPEDAKNIIVVIPEWDYDLHANKFINMSLWNVYKKGVTNKNRLYAPKTDYFIEASCPEYDENNIWFVRDNSGGWFSIDIQNSWQAGKLDIDASIYNHIIQRCIDNGSDPTSYINTTYFKQ